MADLTLTAANVVPGADAKIEYGTAGEAVTAGQIAAIDTATKKLVKADSNSASAPLRSVRGVFLNNAANGQPVAIARSGTVTIGGTVTPGVAYYLSDTPGGLCPVADVGSGEYPVIVGMAISATMLDIDIQAAGVAL